MTTIPDTIPAELRSLRQWVCWRYETRPGQDKPTKIPYTPSTGSRADSTDPATWGTYAQACSAARRYDGIGFVLAPPYVGVDLDSCIEPGGGLRTWPDTPISAAEIVRTLASYTEVSPSGTGLHIICKGQIPGERRRKGPIEMYQGDRYFTITGRVFGNPMEIAERNAGLAEIYGRVFPAPVAAPVEASSGPSLSDDQILAKARAAQNGAKFAALFDQGSTQAHGGDDSAADLALCHHLAFWTTDRAQIDRLMRRSALYRDKWERADYRDRTITQALTNTTEHYSGPRARLGDRPMPASNAAGSSPAPTTPPPDERISDLGNARRLVRHHGGDLRYVGAWGWMAWDGRRWKRDTTGEAMRRAKDTVSRMYTEAAGLPDDERVAYAKWALSSESTSRLKAMLESASTERAVVAEPGDFDADPWRLNCHSGMIDLHTGELHPHDRAVLQTKVAPATYDLAATCPTWLAFLDRIFAGDADLIAFVQRAIGYTLTGSTQEQVLFLLHGTGANGKSTLLNTLQTILGDYAQATPAATLLLKEHDGGINNDVARMAGARFVAAIETEDNRRLAVALIKQMTGGDTITARYLHQEFFEFRPQFKLWFATNHKPVIRDTTESIWRRMMLIPFTVTIKAEERDPTLPQRLLDEAAGILAWAVAGCLAWQREGLRPPAAVNAATAEYRADMDLLAAFLGDCCLLGRRYSVTHKDLYARYTTWAEENGERRPMNSRQFAQQMTERGFPKRNGHANKVTWDGLGLRVEHGPDDPDDETVNEVNEVNENPVFSSYLTHEGKTPELINQINPINPPGICPNCGPTTCTCGRWHNDTD